MSAVLWCLGGASGGAILAIVVMGALSNGAIRDRDAEIHRLNLENKRLKSANLRMKDDLFEVGSLHRDTPPDSEEDDFDWEGAFGYGMGTYTPERR